VPVTAHTFPTTDGGRLLRPPHRHSVRNRGPYFPRTGFVWYASPHGMQLGTRFATIEKNCFSRLQTELPKRCLGSALCWVDYCDLIAIAIRRKRRAICRLFETKCRTWHNFYPLSVALDVRSPLSRQCFEERPDEKYQREPPLPINRFNNRVRRLRGHSYKGVPRCEQKFMLENVWNIRVCLHRLDTLWYDMRFDIWMMTRT
jgi:hypothetical protein